MVIHVRMGRMNGLLLSLVIGLLLFELGLAQTRTHEVRAVLSIPPAVEIRVGNEGATGTILLTRSTRGFEAALHITLCTNAPPTQLYMEVNQPVPLYYSIIQGWEGGASAWMLANGERSWLATVTSPGEHPLALLFRVEGEPSDALSIKLVAQDVLGTKASREVTLSVQP